ncbi:MAG: hypothetical protein QOI95_1130 [Acidimicrobiaceae bacterium]|jgi:hypothetical protein
MSVPEELAELHECFQLRTQAEALQLVACISRRSDPGNVCAVFLDDDRRIVDLFVIQDADSVDDFLPQFVYVTCSPDQTDVTGLVLVSDRTGQVPLDRPGDELRWQELVANAAEGGVTLYDWFIVADRRFAYSLPQFAPTPPQWIAGEDGPDDPRRRVSHADIVDWAQLASLVIEWPDIHEGIECSLLDPNNGDDRRVGIEAAHAGLYDQVRTSGAAPADVLERQLHLHQVLHETVADQLLDNDPPAARETAVRLLDAGYQPHEVLHMLCYAALEHVSSAASNDGPCDDDSYTEDLDRLPDSWLAFANLTASGHE